MVRAPRQLGFRFRTWGGARSNAGRPPKGRTAGVAHLRRPSHSYTHPLHVTIRVGPGLPSLREHSVFSVVRRALADGKQHFGFSLVHFSVQRDHVHLIAEAKDRRALSRGMQGLSIRIARAVNAQLGRKGRLFADRYHARALKTPRTVRLALRYVLLNVHKHVRDPQSLADLPMRHRASPDSSAARRRSRVLRAGGLRAVGGRTRGTVPARDSGPAAGFVDGCSSAAWFAGFRRPLELVFGARSARRDWERASGSSEPPVVAAQCWLLRGGWKRAGLFDVDDTPGSERRAGAH